MVPLDFWKTAIAELKNIKPEIFMLGQNYPNPFNQTTEIQFCTPAATKFKVIIYNSLGEKVKTLVPDNSYTGFYTISWDSKDEAGKIVSSSVYLYKIIAENGTTVRKMLSEYNFLLRRFEIVRLPYRKYNVLLHIFQ